MFFMHAQVARIIWLLRVKVLGVPEHKRRGKRRSRLIARTLKDGPVIWAAELPSEKMMGWVEGVSAAGVKALRPSGTALRDGLDPGSASP
jgi:hypothetical protein